MMRSVVLLSWLGRCYAVETPPVAGRSSGVSPSSGEKVVAGTSESAPTVAGTECGTTPAGATCGGRASPSRPAAASSSATTGALPQEATTGALPAGSSSSAPQQPSSSAASGRRDAEETEEEAARRTRKGIARFNSALGDPSTPPRRRGSRSPKRELHPACRFTPPPPSRWAEGFTAGFVEGQEQTMAAYWKARQRGEWLYASDDREEEKEEEEPELVKEEDDDEVEETGMGVKEECEADEQLRARLTRRPRWEPGTYFQLSRGPPPRDAGQRI